MLGCGEQLPLLASLSLETSMSELDQAHVEERSVVTSAYGMTLLAVLVEETEPGLGHIRRTPGTIVLSYESNMFQRSRRQVLQRLGPSPSHLIPTLWRKSP